MARPLDNFLTRIIPLGKGGGGEFSTREMAPGELLP